jgi:MFS family permease
MPLPKSKSWFFYGWWVVIICFLIHFYTGGTYFYGFTAFFNPIASEFGWSYALISLAMSLRGVESGVLAPVAGILVDKLGPKKLLMGGVIFFGIGFFLLSRVTDLWNFYLTFIILAFGLSMASPVVTMTAITRWFKGKRTSLALGVLMAGYAAGGIVTPAIIWVVDSFGWRQASVIFGVGVILIMLPLSLLIKNPPGEKSSQDINNDRKAAKAPASAFGMTTKEAIKTTDFWLLSFVVLFGGIAATAVYVHLVPYLTSIGISRQTSGIIGLVFALASISGRLVFGWLGDLYDKRKVFAFISLLNAVGALWFTFALDLWQIYISVVLLAVGFGASMPLRPALQNDLFGTKAFGSIQGFLMIFNTLTSVLAPPWAGWIYDTTKSYFMAFLILAIISFLAIPLSLAISKKSHIPNQGSG